MMRQRAALSAALRSRTAGSRDESSAAADDSL